MGTSEVPLRLLLLSQISIYTSPSAESKEETGSWKVAGLGDEKNRLRVQESGCLGKRGGRVQERLKPLLQVGGPVRQCHGAVFLQRLQLPWVQV